MIDVLPGITLRGEDGERPLLRKASFDSRAFVYVQARGTLEGLHLAGTWTPDGPVHDPRDPRYGAGVSGGGGPDAPQGGYRVVDCVIERFIGIGLNLGGYAPGAIVERCTIRDNHDAGIQFGVGTDGCVVRDSVVVRNGFNGIDCNGSRNLIEGNDCSGNGRVGARAPVPNTDDRNGILVVGLGQHARGNRLVGNTCDGNLRSGIMVAAGDRGVSDTLVRDNRCAGNGDGGLTVQGGRGGARHTGTRVVGNTFRDNRWGVVQVFDVAGNELVDNVLTGNRTALAINRGQWAVRGNTVR
jgi:hypothetical protein